MTGRETLRARVRASHALNAELRRIVLEPVTGPLFPAAAGAHILLALRDGATMWRNAYSLAGVPGCRSEYEVIVRRVERSRGGSAFVHERLRVGDELDVGVPQNLFPVARSARKHLMLAGGIGVTPFLSYLPHLAAEELAHELFACCRAEDADAFTALLAPWPDARVVSGRHRLDVTRILAAQPLGTHLYACGPTAFMAHVTQAAAAQGWPAGLVHQERFGGAAPGRPFRAVLARSGITVDVPARQGLLEALEAAGVAAPCLCRGGACGVCRLAVLHGTPEHRDHFLTAADRARQDCVMPCVSRATSDTLVLDI